MSQLPIRPRVTDRSISIASSISDAYLASDSDSISDARPPLEPERDPIATRAAANLNGGKERRAERSLVLQAKMVAGVKQSEIEADLEGLLQSLHSRATELEREVRLLNGIGLFDGTSIYQDTLNIKEGRFDQVIVPDKPQSVRQLVRNLHGDRQECLDLIVQDFVTVGQWALEHEAPKPNKAFNSRSTGSVGRDLGGSEATSSTTSTTSTARQSPADIVHSRLRRRQELLDAMLPPGQGLEDLSRMAIMLVEHQLVGFGKQYANNWSMTNKNTSDITPENLLVTSDNYAWDMSELVDHLARNSAVMRNPLTNGLFSEDDVRLILNHPLGQRLQSTVAAGQIQLKRDAIFLEHTEKQSNIVAKGQSAQEELAIDPNDKFFVAVHEKGKYLATADANDKFLVLFDESDKFLA